MIYRKVNYIKITARIVEKGMGKCSGKYRAYLHYQTKKSQVLCSSSKYMATLKNTAILQEYRFKVSDIAKVQKTSTRIKKQYLEVLEFTHTIKKQKGGNVAIRVFRHYVGVDETTGAVNTEETQADTDLWMIGVITTDEDCGDDGNVKECVAKIDLKSKLTCNTDKKFRMRVTKKNRLFCGEWAYCQLEFQDRTIRKYLHIVKVYVTADGRKKNVVGTGYYRDGKRTNRYTRFRVMSYWDSANVEIKATARVSTIANCADDDCVACNAKKVCKVCRGREIPQNKRCVSKCSSGWFKKNKKCNRCERYCAKCNSATNCQKCAGRKVLYKGDCLSGCPSGYKSNSGVCKAKGWGTGIINSKAYQSKVLSHVSRSYTRFARCFYAGISNNVYYFHYYCNNKAYTLLSVYNSHGWRFGAYVDYQFTNRNTGWKVGRENKRAFLYSQTTNFFAHNIGRYYTIYDNNGYGPTYGSGHDLYIRQYPKSYTGSYTNLGNAYRASYYSRAKNTILGGTYASWKVLNYEVWYRY